MISRNWRNWIPTPLESGALLLALIFAVIFPTLPWTGLDYQIFVFQFPSEGFQKMAYSPWIIPYLVGLNRLPLMTGYMINNLIQVLCIYVAAHLLKGNKTLLLTSYPLGYVFFYGQMTGILVLAFAWMIRSVQADRPVQAAAACMILLIKLYLGLFAFAILVLYGSWKTRTRTVLLVVIGVGLSLIIWQGWPGRMIDFLRAENVMTAGGEYELTNISYWVFTGPIILLAWLPVLSVSPREWTLIWWTAAVIVTSPFMHADALLFLLVLPVGWVGWANVVYYLTGPYLRLQGQLIPTLVYIQQLVPALDENWLIGWVRHRLHPPTPSE